MIWLILAMFALSIPAGRLISLCVLEHYAGTHPDWYTERLVVLRIMLRSLPFMVLWGVVLNLAVWAIWQVRP